MLPGGLLRRGHVQALGAREQPVQADRFQAVILDGLAGLLALGGRDLRRRGPERERRDLDAVIAEPGRDRGDLSHRRVLEHLVAECELHSSPMDQG
jgi:hypothetical protein